MNILVVEDNALLNHHITTLLAQAKHHVYSAGCCQAAQYYMAEYFIDVALIDLGLPDGDGVQLIHQIKALQFPFPIIVLTARSSWQDKVNALDAGADDYLVKPFQRDELLARLRALVRRQGGFIFPTVKVGDYEIDPSRQTVRIGEHCAYLTRYEFIILMYLIRHVRKVVSKSALLGQLDSNTTGDINTVEVMVSRLRKKLDPDGTIQPITTLRRQGYLLNLNVPDPPVPRHPQ
jgi:two-component system response regulator PhoP